ncbi:MAG: PAS domain S-box protein [Betaproteobacteria bacterium]
MPLTIRPKTAVSLLTLLTIFLIVAAVLLLTLDMRKRELAHAQLETLSITKMLMEQTEEAFDTSDLILKGIQDRLQTAYGSQFSLDSFPVHLLLSARITGITRISTLFIVDVDGRVINSSGNYPASRISVTDREYFKNFSADKKESLFISRPVRRLSDKSWTLHLARKIFGSDGKYRGIIVAAVSLDYFEKLYEFMELDFVRPIALYRTDGILVASKPHRENSIGEQAIELDAETLSVPEGALRTVIHISGDGTQQVFSLGRVKRFPLLVSVTNEQDEALASWRETATPIALGAGLVCVFIIFAAALLIRELSREHLLSEALRESDDRYHRTIESVTDAIIAIDEKQAIILFNPAAERMFGLSVEESSGRQIEDLISETQQIAFRKYLNDNFYSDPDSLALSPPEEFSGRHTNGREFPIESSISKTLIGGKFQLTAVLRDITLRRQAEAEQKESNRQLRKLSAALQKVREQERTRIAHELHDDLGQQLTGLKLDLSWLNGRLREGRPIQHDKLDTMRHLLDTAIAAVRRISTELRPQILDDLGFGEAVIWQAGELSKRSGIEITLNLPAAEFIESDALATAMFRIVQESLTNIVRHAEATHVNIQLVADSGNFVLTIIDNGKGFAPSARKIGIGLISMRERATALGGTFTFTNQPEGGTAIRVSVPMNQLDSTGDKS